jgi:hypothetical protein
VVVGLASLSSHTSVQNTGRQTIRSEINPKVTGPKWSHADRRCERYDNRRNALRADLLVSHAGGGDARYRERRNPPVISGSALHIGPYQVPHNARRLLSEPSPNAGSMTVARSRPSRYRGARVRE